VRVSTHEKSVDEWLAELEKPLNWRVVEVRQGKKVWYEVRAEDSALVVTNSDSLAPWRFRSERSAMRCAIRENKREREHVNREETWL